MKAHSSEREVLVVVVAVLAVVFVMGERVVVVGLAVFWADARAKESTKNPQKTFILSIFDTFFQLQSGQLILQISR